MRCTSAHAQERGREPAVCRADVLAQALPQLLRRLPPVSWRTPLQSRSCNHGGFTSPALIGVGECHRAIECLVMHERSRNARGLTPAALVRARSLADRTATFTMHKRTISARSGGCQPPGVVGNRVAGTLTHIFRHSRRTQHQERRVSARCGSGDALARTLSQSRGRLPTVC